MNSHEFIKNKNWLFDSYILCLEINIVDNLLDWLKMQF